MWFQKLLFTTAILVASASGAIAQSAIPKIGDIYIISRDDNRIFRGSHRIYTRQADGLVEVEYCNRSYWVRAATVAWTQLEVEQSFVVRVEFNRGKGWRPICSHPEEQVTLRDLGITEDPRVVIQNDGPTVDKVKRFAAIRKAFNPKGTENAAQSFHDE
ncbi:MAG: hypothetical protein RIE06_18780 [Roseibium album]|uniref:Uncharacterized protein n=1 Tax=Roseibium album TaxID=311410 RepID=A0A0M7B0M3_9HYPH|nr:hypothetical protein [Roseibium album]MBG6143652.1 hypothetical protein [Labrenzia sp. EL_142]MBG6200244.1 hypothetical protein [Labrenzia sp. EL_13]MCR9060331.1 hypothetical protein [Paracoccaceae bacterium]CTQ62285.1 hypothetical protein LA5094_05071 [Roseibium album]CTQ77821.1 hypothetical protein LA5096_05298 [Roseibium album]